MASLTVSVKFICDLNIPRLSTTSHTSSSEDVQQVAMQWTLKTHRPTSTEEKYAKQITNVKKILGYRNFEMQDIYAMNLNISLPFWQ